ncbi:MAG: hypothetical protein AAB421_03650 [Patescibacteria group bacterium]
MPFTLFPELLYLAPVGAFLIRVSVAVVFALAAYEHVHIKTGSRLYFLSSVETLTALSLAAGFYLQAGAFLGIFLSIIWLARPAIRPYASSTAWLVLAMCTSLLVTGAGAFAFDMPL